LGNATASASIKGAIGHTLGAAGIMNAVVACLALREGFSPGTANLLNVDPLIRTDVQKHPKPEAPHHVLTNAFGFGGSNAVLIFGKNAA
jgi:3-oxoacyl-[acyl-carrier-protein] synthase-1